MVQTVYVSSAAQLKSALASVSTDTKFVLKGGDYGNLNLYAQQQPHLKKVALTFTSENASNPASFDGMNVVGIDNLTLDGLTFDYTSPRGAHQSTNWARIEQGNNITVRNCTFDGDNAKGLSNVDNGYGTGTGLFTRYIKNLTIENNTAYTFFDGYTVVSSDNVVVKGNEAYDLASDGLNFASVTQTLIEGNYIHDFRVHPNTYTHNDMLQIWSKNQNSPTTDVTIRGNIFDNGSGPATQSIWINNEAIVHQGAGSNMLYRNFVIEDNVIRNSQKHGIAVNNMDGLVVRNNTIVQNEASSADDSALYTPIIAINGGMKNVTVKDNVVHDISGKNWSGSGNLYIQRKWTTEPNHFNDLFVNGLSDDLGTWDDLMALPGGTIEKQGIGSSLLRYDTSPSQPTGLILSDDGAQLARHHHTFDISNVYGPSGKISTNGAKVVWDFGDGKTGSGINPTHVYTKPGVYEVTATVRLANGKTLTADKVIEVETPILVHADFQNGGKDISGFQTPDQVKGVSFVNDGGSKVGKFGPNNYIRYTGTEELFNNEGFTMLVDFRKDQAGDKGRIVNFSDAFIIKIFGDFIRVTVVTDQAKKTFDIKGAGINNTAWHRLAVTWDEKTDKAAVYIDGQQKGASVSIKGTMLAGNKAQDFLIGSSAGDAFTGLVDNAIFLGGAMDAGEVASLHSGHQSLDQILNSTAGSSGSSLPTVPTTPTTPTPPSTPATPTQPASATGEVDTGKIVKGVWRYYLDDPADAALIRGNVTQKDLDILLQFGRIKIDADGNGKYDNIIHLVGNGWDKGSFSTAPAANGKTLVSFQADGASAPTPPTPPTTPSTPTTPATPAPTIGEVDTGKKVQGVWRYYLDDPTDAAKVRGNITQKDLDVLLQWGRIKIDADGNGRYDNIIHLEGKGWDKGSFVTSKVSGGTLVSFQADGASSGGSGGAGSSSGSGGSSGGSSGSSSGGGTPAPPTFSQIDTGNKVKGIWRYTLDDASDPTDAAKVRGNITQKDLDVLLQFGRVKIDTDGNGKYDNIIHLEGKGWNKGAFVTTDAGSNATYVSFQPAGSAASSGSGSGSGSGSTPAPTGKIISDFTKSNGVAFYKMKKTTDQVFIDDKFAERDMQIHDKHGRIHIDANRDGKKDYSIHLNGDFSSGDFVTTSYNGGTLISFQSDNFDFG